MNIIDILMGFIASIGSGLIVTKISELKDNKDKKNIITKWRKAKISEENILCQLASEGLFLILTPEEICTIVHEQIREIIETIEIINGLNLYKNIKDIEEKYKLGYSVSREEIDANFQLISNNSKRLSLLYRFSESPEIQKLKELTAEYEIMKKYTSSKY